MTKQCLDEFLALQIPLLVIVAVTLSARS